MPRIPSMTKKDKFADLDPDWKDKVAGSSAEQIDTILAQVAKDQEASEQAKEDDEDYQQKKEEFKVAGEQYREAKKANRLKTQYCIRVLKDQGKE